MFAWFVEFPLSQYQENALDLAREKGLIIINAEFQGEREQIKDPPRLTRRYEQLVEQEPVKLTSSESLMNGGGNK